MIEFDQISYFSYWISVQAAWALHWLRLLRAEYFGQPLVIKVAILVIIGSVLAMSVIVAAMLWRMQREWRQRRNLERVRRRFGAKIDHVMSDPDVVDQNLGIDDILEIFGIRKGKSEKESLQQARNLIRSKRDKRLFCQLVYERLLADTGELCSLNNIRRMLEVLGLYRFLEQELDHGNWRTKVRSLNMMSMFRLKVDAWLTNALLLSKSQTVRRLAVHASIMSGGDAKLDYFESDRFDRLCCIKDEIELGYSLQRRRSAGQKLPDLARLALLHDEVDAQCIFVKLMRYFGQSEHCSQLVDLFRDSKDHRLAMEIASTWGYLKYTDGEALLQEALLTRSDDVQVSFMQALTRMDTGRSVDALAGVFATAASSVTSYEALRCLYNYGQAGRRKFDELKAAARDTAKEVLFAPFEKASMAPFIAMDKALDYAPAEATVYNVHE